MSIISEKVVVSMTTAAVEIDIDAIPKHEIDTLCRSLIRSVTEAMKNPKFAADYEVWRAKRYGKEART